MGRYSGRQCRLLCMVALTATFFLVEIVCGYITNSMALVADSFHMLSDIAAIIIAFMSVKMSPKKWSKNTFGWARAEVLGALVNAVFLVALCFSILMESLKRLYEIEEIHDPVMMLYVGGLGLAVNVVGLFLFHQHGGHGHSHGGGGGHGHSHGGGGSHGHSHLRTAALPSVNDMLPATEDENDNDEDNCTESHPANGGLPNGTLAVKGGGKGGEGEDGGEGGGSKNGSMNMRGVFLHVLADALGSVIVIASALVIWLTEWKYKFYVDPVLSILMVTLILKTCYPLLVESALILLQTVPTHIKVEAIEKKLLTQISDIQAVHEFHVWQLAGDRIIASAHIRCRNLPDYMRIAEKVKEFFHNEGIHSTTIQPEFSELTERKETGDASDCVLDCPSDKKCAASTCCGTKKDGGKESPNLGGGGGPLADAGCRQRVNTGSSFSAAAVDGEHFETVSLTNGGRDVSAMESGNLYANQRDAHV